MYTTPAGMLLRFILLSIDIFFFLSLFSFAYPAQVAPRPRAPRGFRSKHEEKKKGEGERQKHACGIKHRHVLRRARHSWLFGNPSYSTETRSGATAMAKSRRTTRLTAGPVKQEEGDGEAVNDSAQPSVSENDLNDALENTLDNNNNDAEEADGEAEVDQEQDQDDGEEYQPEADPDAGDEDVSMNNDDVDDRSIKAEDNGDSDGNTSSTSLKRKNATGSRRQKHSNLNAVNRKRQQLTPVGGDDELEEDAQPVENDEFITPDDDKGDKKITELGVLKGGREFRVKTFKVPGRGDRMYAISTDVARLVGYRDSYFLFQKHTNLYRVRIDEDSKMSLINDDYLPVTFKTRAAYLITARSAFKEFGARIIVDGKQVVDDYYEDKAREEGAIEGALINPVLSNDGYNNSVTDNQTLFERQRNIALLLSNNNILETETSWVYDHALKCRQFDSMLFYDRNELLKKQVQRDIYTNLNFVPDITQPTRCKVTKLKSDANESKRKIIFDTVIGGSSVVTTGLADVPLDVFDGTVSEDVRKAILEQQQLERSL